MADEDPEDSSAGSTPPIPDAKPDVAAEPKPDVAAESKPKRQMTPELYSRLVAPIAEPKSEEEYGAIPAGKKWRDPEGNVRVKPFEPSSPDEYWDLPEGAHWKDPGGNVNVKPKYEGIGFTAQTLYSMALTDEGREQALKKVYDPDKVKRGPGGRLYIDDDGVLRAPGHGASRLGAAVAETPIAAGMTAGFVAGGGPTPLGAAGAAIGGILGAMEGRAFNSSVLALAGIHEPLSEQIKAVGFEGAATAGGEVVGRGIARIPGAVSAAKETAKRAGSKAKGVVTGLSDILEGWGITPERARSFLGTTQEMAETASGIAEKAGDIRNVVPPSALAPEAPYLKKVQEFDQIFRSQNVFFQGATDFYNQQAGKLATDVGASLEEQLTSATKGVSSQRAGELAISAAQRDSAFADAALEDARRQAEQVLKQPIVEAGGEQAVARMRQEALQNLEARAVESRQSAERVFQENIAELRRDVNTMLEQVGEGEDPSAVSRMIEGRFRAYDAALRMRSREMYNTARTAATGEPPPNIAPLFDDAKAFFGSIPDVVKQKYPSDVRIIERMARQAEEAQAGKTTIQRPGGATSEIFTGEQPPETLDWSDLHQLRSWLRHGIDYNDLTPDMRQGSLKFFAKKVDAVLHDPNATPGLKQAARLLDDADAFYKQHIPFLNDEMVRQSLKAFRSGAGVDAESVADMFFKPGRSAALQQARGIVGENSWRAVEAARVRSILNNALDLGGGHDGRKIAAQVLEDHRNGLLRTGYTVRNAERLAKIADDANRLEGKLPIKVEDTDTISSLLRKVEAAKQEMEHLAQHDPIASLSKEVKKLDVDFNKAMAAQNKARSQEALGFLYQPSALAVKSADRIIGSPDLLAAAANQFGRESAEFKALQEVFVLRFFQRPANRIGLLRPEMAGEVGGGLFGKAGVSEETLALMFPGVTRGQLTTLAKEMEFLFTGTGESFGGGMAGAARVLNPMSHIPLPSGAISRFILGIPGVSTVGRVTLGKVFATTMDAVSHPNFIHWLAGKLNGTSQERMLARAALQDRLRLGGWLGAAAGEQATVPNPQPAEALQ